MLSVALDKPIRTEEAYHVMRLYFDLDEAGRNKVFAQYDNEDDARFYIDGEFEDLHNAARWFVEQTGCMLEFDGYAERWNSDESIYNGYGYLRAFHAIPENAWGMCYELDALQAWNKHASRLEYLCERLEGTLYEEPARYAHSSDWYEEHYQEELDSALGDVCKALNDALAGAYQYTTTRDFFEYEYLETSDSEHWFTDDGAREMVRDSRNCYFVDTCTDCDVIFENHNPMRLYVREYVE